MHYIFINYFLVASFAMYLISNRINGLSLFYIMYSISYYFPIFVYFYSLYLFISMHFMSKSMVFIIKTFSYFERLAQFLISVYDTFDMDTGGIVTTQSQRAIEKKKLKLKLNNRG